MTEITSTKLTLSLGATVSISTGAEYSDWVSDSVQKRFWDKVEKSSSCWIWTAAQDHNGYGLFWERKLVPAHRYSYLLHFGEFPDGQVDHLCFNRSCVNPDHLRREPLTNKQNSERRAGANKNSKSGIRGVYRDGGRWRAKVMHNSKNIYLGNFSSLQEAEAAVIKKRKEIFTYSDEEM